MSEVAPLKVNETIPLAHHSVEEHYDKVWTEEEGEAWESWPFFRQQPSALSFALDRLAPNASLADKRVLDLACGVGYSTQELAGRGARVFPLDLSAQGLRKTLQRLERANLADKVAAVRSSVEQLPFAAESIEAVFAQNFLMMPIQIAHDTRIPEQLGEVSLGKNQIEMIRPIGLLCDLEFSLQVSRLALHQCYLLIG